MPNPPTPIAPDLRSQFMLRQDVAFLNHGSFGALPREVFEAQNDWRRRIEAEPVEIIARQIDTLMADAKGAVASFLGMSPADFGLVTNATEGINSYLRSLRLNPGDELLATNHVYNAVRQTMKYIGATTGAVYREFPISTPLANAQAMIDAIERELREETRLLVIDHISSPTALIFPVAEIIRICEKRGVDVLVDGAHAPGMLPLEIASLGAAAYAGNLHKWSCCPKGSAFVWVRPDRQEPVHPCTVSHFRGEGFAREFDWQGTRDLSAWFSIPAGLRFMGDLGWDRIRRHNHELAVWAGDMLARRWGVTPLAPADGSLSGSMAALPLPGRFQQMTMADGAALQQSLYTDDSVEAPIMFWNDRWHLRVSCQMYNRPDEYERVAAAILRRLH